MLGVPSYFTGRGVRGTVLGRAMEEIRERLLDVWREACQHIEISESVQSIAAIVATQFPLLELLILRFEEDRFSLEKVAEGCLEGQTVEAKNICTLSSARWKRIVQWARQQQVAWVQSGHSANQDLSDLVADILPHDTHYPCVVGPLVHEEKPSGLVVFVGQLQHAIQPRHLDLAQHLLEPFRVALENDRRLQELNALREAAEADRQSLLSRLGKQQINEEVVGANTGLRNVMERVELVAKSDVPVLILGETGTGKEVVSRAIHTRSKRSGGPFIRVNCGAIPSELIDSQLFGHEKGSFTGASDQHQGWFERADGGTLFLDEIGELPLAAQVRLLRVLQDHQVERIGGKQPIHVDVRIIAATHRDLAAMVKARQFREDLWYRINVFPILLPRLRERLEDIPFLVRHFVQRAAVRFGLPVVEPTPADLRLLMAYGWPGNIRELGAVIDRAAILGNGRTLEVATSLGLSQVSHASTPANGAGRQEEEPVEEATFYEVIPESNGSAQSRVPISSEIGTLDAAMREHIQRALKATGGQIEGRKGTAAMLGINPHTLRARMRKLKIDWAQYRTAGLESNI